MKGRCPPAFTVPPGSLHIPSVCLDKKGVELTYSIKCPDHGLNSISVARERLVSGSAVPGDGGTPSTSCVLKPSSAV